MKTSILRAALFLVCAVWLTALSAKTLRFTLADDATTLDPHAANLLANSRLLSSIYEGLVARDKDFKIAPGLALS